MRVVLVEPNKSARVEDIDDSYESLSDIVGGYIEAIYPFDENVALVCNEEGKLMGLPFNRALKNTKGKVVDLLMGTFFIAGIGEDDFENIPEELEQKFVDMFAEPENFAIAYLGLMGYDIP